jgi:hypothetical protein
MVKQLVCLFGCHLHDVFAIIEDEQMATHCEPSGCAFERASCLSWGSADRLGDGLRYLIRGLDPGKFNEPNAAGVALASGTGDLESKPSLANPSRAGDRDEAVSVKQGAKVLQFAFAATKPGQGNRNARYVGQVHPHVALHDSHDRKGRQRPHGVVDTPPRPPSSATTPQSARYRTGETS